MVVIANTARGPELQLAHASRVSRVNVVDVAIAIDTQRGGVCLGDRYCESVLLFALIESSVKSKKSPH